MLFRKRQREAAAPQQKSSVLSDLIALHGPTNASWSGRDSVSIAASGFKGNVIAYRCIQMIADAAASVSLSVCEAGFKNEAHPIQSLLKTPSADRCGQELLEAIYGHLQIHGNAYIEIVGPRSSPAALYLLRPDRMSIETDQNGWPEAWVYKIGARERRIGRGDDGSIPVIHFRLFNPLDDQYGQSPLQVAANAVDLHNSSVAWNKSLLDNAARPSGALVYRGVEGAPNLTGEQFDRLKSELSSTYSGGGHAGRPMVLDGGLEWRPMSLSPAEMDFIDLKNSAARDIALAFGVPPMLLGIPGDNTYSNYQQAILAFWRQTVLPLVGKVASTLTTDLKLSPACVDFDVEKIEALADSRSSRLNAILGADFLTDAEKRTALGFPAEPSVLPA